MKIIVGLGNIGAQYDNTYHNIGFMAADCLAEKLNAKFKKRECEAITAECNINGGKVIIAKPLTFMNLSGIAVKQLLKKNKADIKDLIVFTDDIDLDKGVIRKRLSGSGGTHNGMKNIIECINSTDFTRVRIGVGRPNEFQNLADYVLSVIPKADREIINDAIETAVDEVMAIITDIK